MKQLVSKVIISALRGGPTVRRYGAVNPLIFIAIIFMLAQFVSTAASASVSSAMYARAW